MNSCVVQIFSEYILQAIGMLFGYNGRHLVSIYISMNKANTMTLEGIANTLDKILARLDAIEVALVNNERSTAGDPYNVDTAKDIEERISIARSVRQTLRNQTSLSPTQKAHIERSKKVNSYLADHAELRSKIEKAAQIRNESVNISEGRIADLRRRNLDRITGTTVDVVFDSVHHDEYTSKAVDTLLAILQKYASDDDIEKLKKRFKK